MLCEESSCNHREKEIVFENLISFLYQIAHIKCKWCEIISFLFHFLSFLWAELCKMVKRKSVFTFNLYQSYTGSFIWKRWKRTSVLDTFNDILKVSLVLKHPVGWAILLLGLRKWKFQLKGDHNKLRMPTQLTWIGTSKSSPLKIQTFVCAVCCCLPHIHVKI